MRDRRSNNSCLNIEGGCFERLNAERALILQVRADIFYESEEFFLDIIH